MLTSNQTALTATSTATSTSTTATATGVAGRRIQVVGFSASSSDQPFKVELKFGSTVALTLRGAADNAVGHYFAGLGPIAATEETVTVVTTPDASGTVDANLIYRFV